AARATMRGTIDVRSIHRINSPTLSRIGTIWRDLFFSCRANDQRGIIRRVKYWQTALTILVTLPASLALADDFKTNDGKEYKNATVRRVEPDGIVVSTKRGISKLYFTELSEDVRKQFHYDPEKAAAHAAQEAAAQQAGAQQAEESIRQQKGQQKQQGEQ